MTDERRTAYLGRWDELEVPIVLDILSEAGIFAFAKDDLESPATPVYPQLGERGTVLVDASRLEDARRLVDEELPKHLEAIATSMEDVDVGEAPGDEPEP